MGEELKQLLRSGFVRDTLFPITGRPENVRMMSENERRILPGTGRFRPRKDQIVLRSGRSGEGMRRTLTHEAGHKLLRSFIQQIRQGKLPDREQHLLTRQLPSSFRSLQGIEDPSARQQHARKNQQEHFATAFQRALDVLRIPEGARRDSAVAAAEKEIPGTKAMVDFFNKHDVFQK